MFFLSTKTMTLKLSFTKDKDLDFPNFAKFVPCKLMKLLLNNSYNEG